MSDNTWTDALSTDDLPSDDVIGLSVAGRDIAVYTVGDEVYATDNLCTHGNARLCDGFLEGHEIECPCTRASSTCATAARPARQSPRRCAATR